MEEFDNYLKALIYLHSGLDRQGPGDPDFSEYIISQIPGLPQRPRIADLGCGAGAGALLLAERFHSRVRAADFSRAFLDQLMERAKQRGLEGLIEAIECDIGNLDWEPGTVDLLWSEGAAYTITFEGALEFWRPLLTVDGIAVISEMNYFSENITETVTEYMKNLYPGIKTESGNMNLINSSGFELLGVHRLPAAAWWKNYYGPLRERIIEINNPDDAQLQAVIRETEQEMEYFKEHATEYGYTYYIMRAI